MIKINEDFEFERYNHGWKLVEWRDTVNPLTKVEGRGSKDTYYPTVEQIMNQVLDRSIANASDCAEVLTCIEKAKQEVKACIELNAEAISESC